MSCEVDILPHPIEATLIKLLGAFLPKTLAGTIVGIPLRIIDPPVTFAAVVRKFLLLTDFSFFFIVVGLWLLKNKCFF